MYLKSMFRGNVRQLWIYKKEQKHFLVVIKIDQLPGACHICTCRSGNLWPWVRFLQHGTGRWSTHPVSSRWGGRHTPAPFHDCRAVTTRLKAPEICHMCTHHIYFPFLGFVFLLKMSGRTVFPCILHPCPLPLPIIHSLLTTLSQQIVITNKKWSVSSAG